MPSKTSRVSAASLMEVLCARSQQSPQAKAFNFFDQGRQVDSLTYGELDAAARASAGRIRALGPVGQRIFLMHPPGLDFIVDLFGCFYAGAVAIPLPPPSFRSHDRFMSLLGEAGPGAIIAPANLIRRLRERLEFEKDSHKIALASLPREYDSTFQPAPSDADSPAVIQFTSGSTSDSRGVALTHRNILSNLEQMEQAFFPDPESLDESVALWLPQFHDMGLFSRMQCVWAGRPGHLMSPLEFTQRPFRWLELVSKTRATVSGGPNFAFQLCAETIPDEARRQLDLSRWRVAFCGSEPVRGSTLELFADTFRQCGLARTAITPCYGLAEATLMVSCAAPDQLYRTLSVEPASLADGDVIAAESGGSRLLVSCGAIAQGMELKIVDPETCHALPDGRVGEIWLRGPNVSSGYWGRQQESADTFRARLKDGETGVFLRTGDLGFIHDGNLYITGRLKELVIVNGRNIYCHDIEQAVREAHPALHGARVAAFAVETGQGERPVVLYETPRAARSDPRMLPPTPQAIRNCLNTVFEVEPARVVAVRRGSIHLTTSGKIARHKCREALEAGALMVDAEWPVSLPSADGIADPTEAALGRLFEEISKTPCPDPALPLKELGGDSIMAARLLARIRDTFEVDLDQTTIVSPSIRTLAEEIRRLLVHKIEAMSDAEAAELLAAMEGPSFSEEFSAVSEAGNRKHG